MIKHFFDDMSDELTCMLPIKKANSNKPAMMIRISKMISHSYELTSRVCVNELQKQNVTALKPKMVTPVSPRESGDHDYCFNHKEHMKRSLCFWHTSSLFTHESLLRKSVILNW